MVAKRAMVCVLGSAASPAFCFCHSARTGGSTIILLFGEFSCLLLQRSLLVVLPFSRTVWVSLASVGVSGSCVRPLGPLRLLLRWLSLTPKL